MFWLGLAVGLFIGGSLGAVIMGCLVAAKRADNAEEQPVTHGNADAANATILRSVASRVVRQRRVGTE